MAKKALLAAWILLVGSLAALATAPSKADTFYGTLVPMSTPVTLSAAESSILIGTTTQLTAGGGDGTGGYRYNNNSNGFCSVNSSGVVTANYPGNCSITVTRLASGKYLDTTSSAVTITGLPEPDKSVISTPSPEPTPSATPRVIITATPTPSSSPAAPAIAPRDNSPAVKAEPKPSLANISSLQGTLISAGKESKYKFGWNNDLNAKSYSINLTGTSTKKSFSSTTNSIEISALEPGNYSIVIQAIDANGKLSKPATFTFTIPAAKTVKLITTATLAKPVIDSSLAKNLDRFVLATTIGLPVTLNIEYSKTKKNQVAVGKLKLLVEKYLKDKLVGSAVTVSLVVVSDSNDLATLKGTGSYLSKTLLIRKK
jgi:hypothetical protein